MASEDPTSMFADMKKKKKKPKVAFAEDPANADADPTYPPKEPIDDPSLGPATVHERVQNNQTASGNAEDGTEGTNMFADLKKKKKKKDLAADVEGDATPADGGADALDFSDLKKKKKKKEVVELEDAPAPTEDAAPLDDFSDLKKKKKKKDIPLDLEDGATGAPTDDFSDLKKKKKKKDIPMEFDGAAEGAGADGGEDLKKKKKKKNLAMEEFEKEFGDAPDASATAKPKKAKKVAEESDDEADGEDGEAEYEEVEEIDEEELGENPFANSGGGGRGDADEPWLDSDRDYTYDELLSRFFRLLHAQNPSLASSSSKRYTLAPPSIHRDGNKKSVFANIGDICRRMHREPQHVISFLLVEMGTTGSVDGSGRLVIKGKFQQKQIENILRRYIVEYVTCKTCKSPDTLLTKETRISFITCESCGSRQSVSAIKAGFQAQVGKRKKQQV